MLSMNPSQPDDVDAVAAALRADAADLDVYARVLTGSLQEALPVGMVDVERDRSMGDRLAGRPGRVTSIQIKTGDWELTLRVGRGLPIAHVRQLVRGVAISSREVELDEWTSILARVLAQRADESAAAREALGRLLGQS